jgi:hypothetical protein
MKSTINEKERKKERKKERQYEINVGKFTLQPILSYQFFTTGQYTEGMEC